MRVQVHLLIYFVGTSIHVLSSSGHPTLISLFNHKTEEVFFLRGKMVLPQLLFQYVLVLVG